MRQDKNENQLDILLKDCLHTEREPDDLLHRKIMRAWRKSGQQANVRKPTFKVAAAVIAAAVLLTSVSAYAASRLLSASEAAGKLGQKKVSGLFEGDDAIYINETQEEKGYSYTLLGITEGEKLLYIPSSVDSDSFYAVVAITNTDGSSLSMEDYLENGRISFLLMIQGLESDQQMYTFAETYTGMEVDGAVYYLIACDKISYFADREIYLGISDDSTLGQKAYHYDDKTGIITPNEEYEGINLLFRLPIDESKADPQRAQEYLEQVSEKQKETSRKEVSPEEIAEELFGNHPDAKKDYLTIEKALEAKQEKIDFVLKDLGAQVINCQTVEETEGEFRFEPVITDKFTSQMTCCRDDFEDGMFSGVGNSWSGKEGALFWEIVKLNADHTATYTCYRMDYQE